MKTYDELPKEEEKKFKAYNLWMHNQLISMSWFVNFLFAIVILSGISAMFFTGLARDLWMACYILYALLIAGMAIKRLKIIKKERKLIFGIGKEENMYFFGITEQDVNVTWREILRNYGKEDNK